MHRPWEAGGGGTGAPHMNWRSVIVARGKRLHSTETDQGAKGEREVLHGRPMQAPQGVPLPCKGWAPKLAFPSGTNSAQGANHQVTKASGARLLDLLALGLGPECCELWRLS